MKTEFDKDFLINIPPNEVNGYKGYINRWFEDRLGKAMSGFILEKYQILQMSAASVSKERHDGSLDVYVRARVSALTYPRGSIVAVKVLESAPSYYKAEGKYIKTTVRKTDKIFSTIPIGTVIPVVVDTCNYIGDKCYCSSKIYMSSNTVESYNVTYDDVEVPENDIAARVNKVKGVLNAIYRYKTPPKDVKCLSIAELLAQKPECISLHPAAHVIPAEVAISKESGVLYNITSSELVKILVSKQDELLDVLEEISVNEKIIVELYTLIKI